MRSTYQNHLGCNKSRVFIWSTYGSLAMQTMQTNLKDVYTLYCLKCFVLFNMLQIHPDKFKIMVKNVKKQQRCQT